MIIAKNRNNQYLCAGCLMDVGRSLLVVQVEFEPESSSSHESSSSQVPFLPFSFSFCFLFVLIKGSDCDSCFHNDVPTDV